MATTSHDKYLYILMGRLSVQVYSRAKRNLG
jgi:hypothetical protein